MKLALLILHILSVGASMQCCSISREISDPTRPTQVRGWEPSEVGSTNIKGAFVLEKGQSTDNGKVGVKVIDIYPAQCRLLDSPKMPKAKIQFYKVSDQTIICESTFDRGGNRLDLPDVCKENLEWSVIYVSDINYKEKWVAFDLR